MSNLYVREFAKYKVNVSTREEKSNSRSCFTVFYVSYFQRRQWQPTPVFLLRESLGQRSLVDCCPWGRRVGHDWSDSARHACILLIRSEIFLSKQFTITGVLRTFLVPSNSYVIWECNNFNKNKHISGPTTLPEILSKHVAEGGREAERGRW